MATQDDVRRLALALPETVEGDESRFAVSVIAGSKHKGLAWVWLERTSPKAARTPQPAVIAIRVADNGEKDALVAAEPRIYFTEDHYTGFPAVLVRLAEIELDELGELLVDAWRCQAPRTLVKRFSVDDLLERQRQV